MPSFRATSKPGGETGYTSHPLPWLPSVSFSRFVCDEVNVAMLAVAVSMHVVLREILHPFSGIKLQLYVFTYSQMRKK